MKLSFFTVGVLASLVVTTAAWSKEDQEIFRLRDEVETFEGAGVTFYDFLETTPSASQDEINKAYKKRSRTLHPDKVKQKFIADKSTGKDKKKSKKPGVHVSKGPTQAEIKATARAASDRFARLGLVTNILRGEGRERYDHFLSNGFPKWKGTGYYYARFRPGLGSVLLGLFIFVGGGGHYVALYMSWKRQQEFVGRYIKFARQAAWGNTINIPGVDGTSIPPVSSEPDNMVQAMNRRQRRMQEKDTKKEKAEKKPKKGKASPTATPPSGESGIKKRVVAENGKILVVDAVGNVYLEQANEDGETQEFLLDPAEIHKPTMKDTALYRAPIWAYSLSIGRLLNKPESVEEEEEDSDDAQNTPSSSSGAEDFEILEKVNTKSSDNVVRRKKSARDR